MNVLEFGLWSFGLCQIILKNRHFLKNICKICEFWAGHSEDLSRSVECVVVFFPDSNITEKLFFSHLILKSQQHSTFTLQNGRLNTTESCVKMTGISKLNGRSSKRWNLILNVLYCSLWNLLLGILLFLLAEAFFNIPRTLNNILNVVGMESKVLIKAAG